MTTDWQPLADAIARFSAAYMNVLAARAELREGSKKREAAEREFTEAHEARAQVALTYWTEEDGMLGEFKRVGPIIQRYYADTMKAAAEREKAAATTKRKGGK